MYANGSSDDESEAEFDRLLALSAAKSKSLRRRPLSRVKIMPEMVKRLSPVNPPVRRITISSSDSSPELPVSRQARIRIRRTTSRSRALKYALYLSPVKPPVRRITKISSSDSSPEIPQAGIRIRMTSERPIMIQSASESPIMIQSASESPIIIRSASEGSIIIRSTFESQNSPRSGENVESEPEQDGFVTPKRVAKQMQPIKVDATASSKDDSDIEFERLLTASIAKMKGLRRIRLPSSTSSATTAEHPQRPCPHTDHNDDDNDDDEAGSALKTYSQWTRRELLIRTESPPFRHIVSSINNTDARISSAFETLAQISPEDDSIIILSSSESDDDGTSPVDLESAPLDFAERRKYKTDVVKPKAACLNVTKSPVGHKLDALKIRWQDLFDDSSVEGDELNENENGRTKPDDEARNDADRFLRSLDLQSRIVEGRHPAALPYLSDLNRNRSLLADHLYHLFNEHVFNDRLPREMTISWSSRMTSTAGFCRCYYADRVTLTKTCSVVLSSGLLTTAERVRDTLIHELCHAATWLISEYNDVHGPFWQCFARRANIVFPCLPVIARCHNYGLRSEH